jgi:hypothetical protein
MTTRKAGGWPVILIPFLILLLAVPFVVRANRKALHLSNDTTDPESSLIQIGLWAAQSGRLYPSLTEKPFTPAPHGPAYYELLRILAITAPHDFQTLAYKARLISFLIFLLTCLELFVMARRFGIVPMICWIPAVTIFTVPDFYPWSASVRPDMIALFLNVTGMLCFCWGAEANIRNCSASGFFAGAAVVFKQSMAAAFLAIGVTLLFHRRWKDLLAFCLTATIVPLGVIGFLVFHREPILDEMLIMRFFARDLRSEAVQIVELLSWSPSYLALAVLGLCGCRLIWKIQSLRFRAIVLY